MSLMPNGYNAGKDLYKEATGEDWQHLPGESHRDNAIRLHKWCKEYVHDNHRGNEAVRSVQ